MSTIEHLNIEKAQAQIKKREGKIRRGIQINKFLRSASNFGKRALKSGAKHTWSGTKRVGRVGWKATKHVVKNEYHRARGGSRKFYEGHRKAPVRSRRGKRNYNRGHRRYRSY